MNTIRKHKLPHVVVWCLLSLVAPAALAAGSLPVMPDAMPKTPGWQAPPLREVKTRALAWLETNKPDAAVRTKAAALWADAPQQASGADVLGRLAQTFALVDPNAARLLVICSKPRSQAVLPSQAWLTDAKTPSWVGANLRLFYGRWLVQGSWFDEAMEQIAALKPGDVVAPAELLFYQGVAYHRLLNKEEGLKAINQLLDGAEGSPRRYVAVGRLMQADLTGLEPDTLDHVARRMEDIQRRLDLGRAGPKVRKVEDGVIESLDKMIKKIEEQQQQQSSNSGGQLRSSSPAPNSAPLSGRGPGEVTKRNIGNKSGWGDLPPKQREEALQHIGREFPAHYQDIVEQYFRRLATEESNENK